MATKTLMKGNEAIVKGAIAAGCRGFFGYPITPQNEIPEYMSSLMPKAGGVFVQAESEVASINMVYGAACTGTRVMTTSSSPGISLMQEGISYIAGAELPAVIVNVQRGGPGLGNIAVGQADYFQAVKGGGHGDYKLLTLAPWSVSECYHLTALAFDLADKYRNPVMVLADAILGQMIETIEVPDKIETYIPPKPWATTGRKNRDKNIINSLWIVPQVLEELNLKLQAKYALMIEHEVRYDEYKVEDADLVLVAYGTTSRLCKTVVDMARKEGLNVGLFRPISLFPFPSIPLEGLAERGKKLLVVEMSHGQMVEDVRLSVNGKTSVGFYGRSGGMVPTPSEILNQVRDTLNGGSSCSCCCRTRSEEVSR
ncbi:MAG TPA: 3-methyl-2-oxobutanoate dehydrogenase subunit VorB [Armatimonadota bacterium]|nr:3-methyl-2-oxobutanoate dehydrogenase subunit VorB [Armatimonadota bacterium]